MKSITVVIITLLVFSSVPALPAETVTLDALLRAAKENNKELIAARERWEAARARATGARTLDDPRLFLEYKNIPGGDLDVSAAAERMFGVGQMIPFPGKLGARGRAADADAEAAKSEYRAVELMVLSDLKKIYAQYYYLAKAIKTYRETAELMRNYGKIAESRYVVGKSAQSNVLRAQVEAEKLENMVITLEQERETAQIELNLRLGRKADEAVGDPADLAPPSGERKWEKIKEAVLAHSPEISKAKAMVSGRKWNKRLAGLDYLPDFDVSYRRKMMDAAWRGSDVMVGVRVPLWFWKQSAGVREASSALDAAEAEKTNTELLAVSRAKEAFTRVDTSRRLLELYEKSVVPKSEQALRVTQSAFVAGTESFLDLLDALRSYLDFRLESYKYSAEYQQSLAELERITGVELQ